MELAAVQSTACLTPISNDEVAKARVTTREHELGTSARDLRGKVATTVGIAAQVSERGPSIYCYCNTIDTKKWGRTGLQA